MSTVPPICNLGSRTGWRIIIAWLLCIGTPLIATPVIAQLPQLGNPSALVNGVTSAKFFGGVSADNGLTYNSNFAPTDSLDITAAIQVEPGHINQSGNLYVILGLGQQFFMRDASGNFLPWDLTLGNLQATVNNKTLVASESIVVVENAQFGAFGLAGNSFTMFLAYRLTNNPNELYFSGSPAIFTIAPSTNAGAEAAALSLFTSTVSTQIIQNQCIVCHTATGVAATSKLHYLGSNQPDFLQTNFDTLKNYILNEPNGSQLVMTKPQGTLHGGGVQFPAGSQNLAVWTEFVTAVLAIGSGSNQESILKSVAILDNEQTLRKAALLFAGRLPTATELQNIASKTEAELRATIRALMAGSGFKQFLIEGANDRLLTLALEGYPYQAVNRYYYPAVDKLLTSYNANSKVRVETGRAIAREPLELIAHVAMLERPYTEILTAPYIMMNPYSAAIYNSSLTFNNATDENEWKEGVITDYFRCTICGGMSPLSTYNIPTVYPHTGLLNSPVFLGRFPSTETNRNRARARWTYYFFLGVDIEGLALRTTDPAALADENNPTLNNPNCTVCHNIMDPVAGSFQDYGDDGRYRDQPGGFDALANSYKRDRTGPYKPGDRWYADMLAPGFGTKLNPDISSSSALGWLAQELIKDSRFGYGTVNFWYPAVMGREPAAQPENPEDADYVGRLMAYSSEQLLMNAVAADFVAGSHSAGKHNLKDLLVDLVMSDHYRAETVAELTSMQAIELEGVGTGRLLTPEQLNRKLLDITGYNWAYGANSALQSQSAYLLIYGGIDSQGITKRATELTTLMSTVVATMANEASCPMVAQDFALGKNQRKLFPYVELSNLPTNNSTAIRTNIQYLHSKMLGENLALNDPEIDATYNLFNSVWLARLQKGKGATVNSATELCISESAKAMVTSDSFQTLRSWVAVVNYMLRDYRFIHE